MTSSDDKYALIRSISHRTMVSGTKYPVTVYLVLHFAVYR